MAIGLERRQVVLEVHLHLGALAPTLDQRGIRGHAIEPGAERRTAFERVDLAKERHEDVLHDLLGIAMAARDPEGDAVDPRAVPLHQDLEHGRILRAQPLDEHDLRIDARARPLRHGRYSTAGSRRPRSRGCELSANPAGPWLHPTGQSQLRRPLMAEFEYISKSRLQYKDGYRNAYLGEVPEPVVYGVQGALREYYGAKEGPPIASTLDHIVAAVAG
jgi:hypothetical protein